MLKTHEREKLINAIVFFAEKTKHCGKTKLFKLLFLLDFGHFRRTGRSVTGLAYYAWDRGPVPADLYNELDDEPSADFSSAVDIVPERVANYQQLKIVPKRAFDPAHFSTRELHLLDSIAAVYRDKTAKEMVDVTHAENGVWDRVYANGAGRWAPIPYELAVEGENAALVIEKSREFSALKQHYAG